MADFQETYVKIAEATAASRDALNDAVTPLGDSTSYDGLGSDGNVKVIVDVQSSGETGDFNESTISEIQFEIDTLVPANSTWTQVRDIATSDSAYTVLVTALNNYVINNVLGEVSDSGTDSGSYQATLQLFIENDCVWSDPSLGSPASWLSLSTSAGFTVL
jgi:hypothetical protein